MLQRSSKLLQSTHPHLLQPPWTSRTKSPTIPTRISCKLSRRDIAIFFSHSAVLLPASQALLPEITKAEQDEEEQQQQQQESIIIQPQEKYSAEEIPIQSEENAAPESSVVQSEESAATQETISSCVDSSKPPTKRAFFDISIDGQPVGRITIGIYGNSSPFGASRFSDLISGRAGISYRRKEFVKITPNYVQHGGVRSYGVDAELAKKDLKNDALKQEWERARSECAGLRNSEGSVSLIVRDPSKPPPKTKLVARGGKLEIDEEEVGVEPNGTEFVICAKDSPELDDSAMVVGKVVQGMDVVKRLAQVKTVQENLSSPYFRVAKLIGDKRAVVAERGFNRPYSKVLVTNCGLLE